MANTVPRRWRGARRPWLVACAAVAIALVVASSALIVIRLGPTGAAASGHGSTTTTKPALQLTAVTPGLGATLPTGSMLQVTFDAALADTSPLPTLNPPVAGNWTRTTATTLTFVPQVELPPGVTITLAIPGGPDGMTSTSGGYLVHNVATSFTVAPMSTLRVQQLLAQLGYLPLTFTPSTPGSVPAIELAADEPGTFAWKWPNLPAVLTSQWTPGTTNTITRGAIMSFEDQHGLATDGVAGPQVWSALVTAAMQNQTDSYGHWDWVDVSTSLPETVYVWRDGSIVYQTAANTGVPAAATALGTYPVYARYVVTTMTGTNPDGSHYVDPGIPWVSYFNGGDALHGYIRASYGFPQSDGCVEMPPSNAAVVFPYTPIGTLVTVQ